MGGGGVSLEVCACFGGIVCDAMFGSPCNCK
jgi:hypothetical protein